MTTKTYTEPCWVLPPEDGWEDMHFPTRDKAQADVDERNKEREIDGELASGRSPEQLHYLCIEVTCDDCGERLGENEEGYTLHLTGLDDVKDTLEAYDWVETSDGTHHCSGDECHVPSVVVVTR